MMPESINPKVARDSSIKNYFFTGEWLADANPFANIQDVLGQGSIVKWWFGFLIFSQLSDAVAFISGQYVFYRFGFTSMDLVYLFLVGLLVALICFCASITCIKRFGEHFHAGWRTFVLNIVAAIFFTCNTYGITYFCWAAIAASATIGVIIQNSWTRRLVDYQLQATAASMVISCQNFASMCLKIPYAELFVYGLEHTKLPQLDRAEDCNDGAQALRQWCTNSNMTNTFARYGSSHQGKDVTLIASQARVMTGGVLSNMACDVVDFQDTVVNGVSTTCHCAWEAARCPRKPSYIAEQGGPFDILASPFFLSGSIGIVAFVVYLYVLCKKPLAAMEARKKTEVEKWKTLNDAETTGRNPVENS